MEELEGMTISAKPSLLLYSRFKLISMILSCNSITSLSNWSILLSFCVFYNLSLFIILTLTNSVGIYPRRSIVKSPTLAWSMETKTTLLSMHIFLACFSKNYLVRLPLLLTPAFSIKRGAGHFLLPSGDSADPLSHRV